MISLFAMILIVSGDLLLITALIRVQRLIRNLPPGKVRSRWYIMASLITLFVFAYPGHAVILWQKQSTLVDLLVPLVFFLMACFVLLATRLSRRTAIDVMRIRRLERDAATDPLTGVYNRRAMDRHLREIIASAHRYGHSLAILMLDIDYFKDVNDKHGHQTGDEVLVTLAETIALEIREADILTRYGGEEFLVIAPSTDLAGARTEAERLRQSIEARDFTPPGAPEEMGRVNVTVSIGVAAFGEGTADEETLVRAADKNLRLAKEGGRNRVHDGNAS